MESKHRSSQPTSPQINRVCRVHQVDYESLWARLQSDAMEIARSEPGMRSLVQEVILDQECMGGALGLRLARKLAREDMTREELGPLLAGVLQDHPELTMSASADLLAIVERDAACSSPLEPLLYFKGFLAITTYRVSHYLWHNKRRPLALYFQSLASEIFGVDIHPAARIGCGILLDHATSIVVGETAIIEDDVSILHEVTLGGTGKDTGNRHPIVRSGVLIGAGAKILGLVEIGEGAKIGAGSVVLEDVPPHQTAAGVPAEVVGETDEENPALEMDQSLHRSES